MSRRAIITAGALAAAAVLLATGHWFYFVGRVESGIRQWAEDRRAAGIDVDWQELRFAGYPLHIEARFDRARLVSRRADRTIVWNPAALGFRFPSFGAASIDFEAAGKHDVSIVGDGVNRSMTLDAASLAGEVFLAPAGRPGIARIVGRFAGVDMMSAGSDAAVRIDRGTFAVARPARTPVDQRALYPEGVSLVFALEASDIGLPDGAVPDGAAATLGPVIGALALRFSVRGNLDPAALNDETLSEWRDRGGTVAIDDLALDWGPLSLSADGTLSLDDDLQPLGSFVARVSGLEELITALETAGLVAPRDAAVARITVAVLTRAPADGGLPRAELPIIVQDRIVRLGPVPLLQLPRIVWD